MCVENVDEIDTWSVCNIENAFTVKWKNIVGKEEIFLQQKSVGKIGS